LIFTKIFSMSAIMCRSENNFVHDMKSTDRFANVALCLQ
jgi:hypothetical protein